MGGDATAGLDPAKEAFNPVAMRVVMAVEFAGRTAIRLGRDNGSRPAFFEDRNQGIGLVGLVGDSSHAREVLNQHLGAGPIGVLGTGQHPPSELIQALDETMNLGASSGARAC